jgi:hypothetical protein
VPDVPAVNDPVEKADELNEQLALKGKLLAVPVVFAVSVTAPFEDTADATVPALMTAARLEAIPAEVAPCPNAEL